MGLQQMIAAERVELLEFLQTLSPQEWETPSLCAGWRVRDVVAHLLWDTVTIRQYLWVVAKHRHPDRINQYFVEGARELPTAELLTRLAATVNGGWISRTRAAGILADLVVHHQDIRRPLGRPRTIESARLLHAVQHPNRFANPRRITKGLKLTATDLDWTVGTGPEVRGYGEAVALAIVGRPVVLDELDGDGVAILARRIAR